MAKVENLKTFYFELPDGGQVRIDAWGYSYSRGWGHRASVIYVTDGSGKTFYPDFEKRITYYNRTWESFQYESVLQKIIREYFNLKDEKITRQFLLKQIQAIAERESEKCTAWLKAFEVAYNGLSENQKQSLINADIEITSEKQADVALATIQTMALLNA